MEILINLYRRLIIDSWFDKYQGVVSLVRIKNGILHKGETIQIMSTGKIYKVDKLGIFTPKRITREVLNCGEVGWIICSIRNVLGAPVGDTITSIHQPASNALPSFEKIKPKVYADMFPVNSDEHNAFKKAFSKLNLNDSSLTYEIVNSSSLGFGFRCGFLGLLHMEIIKERMEREYNIDIITTFPTVAYEVLTIDRCTFLVTSPSNFPLKKQIKEIREPIAECCIVFPLKYLGIIIILCTEKRGKQIEITYYDNYIKIIYEIPMNEIISDFFNKIKSVSHGYASLDYEFKRFQSSDMVSLNILINKEQIDILSFIVHRSKAQYNGRIFLDKLIKLIPRQQFDIIIQATIDNHIFASSTIKQLRKNVLEKCCGGDVSRKKKLLKNQKKREKTYEKKIGNITLSQKVFQSVFLYE